MKRYKVTVSFRIGSGFTYWLLARNITRAETFVRHWPIVKVERVL